MLLTEKVMAFLLKHFSDSPPPVLKKLTVSSGKAITFQVYTWESGQSRGAVLGPLETPTDSGKGPNVLIMISCTSEETKCSKVAGFMSKRVPWTLTYKEKRDLPFRNPCLIIFLFPESSESSRFPFSLISEYNSGSTLVALRWFLNSPILSRNKAWWRQMMTLSSPQIPALLPKCIYVGAWGLELLLWERGC